MPEPEQVGPRIDYRPQKPQTQSERDTQQHATEFHGAVAEVGAKHMKRDLMRDPVFARTLESINQNGHDCRCDAIGAKPKSAIANYIDGLVSQQQIMHSFMHHGLSEQEAADYANKLWREVRRERAQQGGAGNGQRAGAGQGVGNGQGGGAGGGDEASDEVVAPAVPGAGGGARRTGGFGAGAAGGTGKGIGAAGAAAAGLDKPSFGSSYIESAKSLLRAVLGLMITGAGNNNPFVNIAKMLAGKSMVEVAKTLTEAGMTDEVVNGNPMLRHEALLVDTQAAGLRGIFETAIQYWNQAAQANKQIEKDTHQLAQRA